MAQRNIDFGTFPDDPDADAIRTAFQKVQQNFTEVYAGVEGAAVSSINRTPGAGITVSSPTGNVIITANIACVQFSTFTLSIARDTPTQNPSAQNATITASPQTLQINIPANIANVESANFVSSLTTVSNPGLKVYQTWNNASVGFTGIYENITDTASSSSSKLMDLQVNASSRFTVFKNGNVVATGNATFNDLTANNFVINSVSVSNTITAGNIYANTGTIGASLLTGTLTTNAQPNVTSLGTLTSLAVTGNTTSGNVYANSGTIGASLLTGTLTTNSQPNITSVGTLTSLAVSGNITGGNLQGPLANGNSNVSIPSANGDVTISASGNANILIVTGTGANITGTANISGNANVGNIGATNGVFTSNVSAGNISTTGVLSVTGNANVGNIGATNGLFTTNVSAGNVYANSGTIGANLLTGTLTTNAQPNITSTGILTALQVTGNIEAGNVYSNSGTLGASLLTGTLTTNAQPNVTSLGTLISLTVSGNLGAGNVNAGNLLTANFVTGTLTTNAQPNITSVGTLTSLAVTGNTTSGNVYANSGTIGASLLTGTLTTNAQPNVTSVGTLTSLAVTGNASAGNINAGNLLTANFVTGTLTTNAQPNITSVGNLTNLVSNGTINFANASNVNIGDLANLHISGGSPGYTIKTDGFGNLTWAIDTTAAGGSNTEVQFNDGGTLGGSANYTFNKATNLLSINGNIQSNNANLGNAVTANYFLGNLYGNANTAGTVTTASQPNITSVGALTGLTVSNASGSVNLSNTADINLGVVGNLHISGGLPSTVLTTDGSGNLSFTSFTGSPPGGANTEVQFNDSTAYGGSAGLTFNKVSNTLTVGANVISGNVYANSGTIGANLLTGTLTTNAQPNITSLGTLTGLLVNGNINTGNVSITGVYTGNGSGLSQLAGANVTGTVANATYATSAGSATTAGTVTTAAQPNITSVGTLTSLSVTGNLSAGNVNAGNLLTANFVTGTLTTNAQPNITSVGSLTSLIVNGNINAGNIAGGNLVSANFFSGNGNALFSIQGANVTGTVANATYATSAGSATTAGTVTTAAQPNITSVGTLTSLGVNGTLTGVNITANTGIFSGNGSGLTSIAGANVTGTVANATYATSAGSATSATTAGTVTTASQPNITSLGTLGSLTVAPSSVNQLAVSGTNVTIGTSRTNNLLVNSNTVFNTDTTVTFNNMTGDYMLLNGSGSGDGLSIQGSDVSTIVTLASRSQLFYGDAGLFIASTSSGSTKKGIVFANSGQFNFLEGALTTNAQPNITSLGTLTGLGVNGTITAVNITANTGVFTGNANGLSSVQAGNIVGTTLSSSVVNSSLTAVGTITGGVWNNNIGSSATFAAGLSGANLSSITGGNVSGQVGNALVAGTVYTAAQPNITSVGTLTSLTSSGNISAANVSVTGYHIRSVTNSISAAGTVQSNATALTTELNVVSTVASGAGVRLPAAVAGMVITITNISANALLVYPNTSAAINTLSANVALSQASGATIQFIAPTSTQWYTVGATYS